MSHRAASGPFSGCGSYVTGPGGWLGVSAIGKVIEPWAMDIIKETSTYAEVSPSGKGRFHALAKKRIKIPARQRREPTGARCYAVIRSSWSFLGTGLCLRVKSVAQISSCWMSILTRA